METGSGKHATATLNNPQTAQALQLLKRMRWTDNSMGANFDYGWSDINQAFAAGKVGMYVSGSDVFTNLVQANNIDASIYGVTTLPLAGNKTPACSAAAPCAAVKPNASADEKAAAVKWIDFYYEQKLLSKHQAIRDAKSLIAAEAARRRPGAADLQQDPVRPGEHLDQAVHQRARRPR